MVNISPAKAAERLGLSERQFKALAVREAWPHRHFAKGKNIVCDTPCFRFSHWVFSDVDIEAINDQHARNVKVPVYGPAVRPAIPLSTMQKRKTRSDAGVPRKSK